MIEVHISKDKLDAAGHDTLVGIRLIGNLREAGVPVVGSSFTMRGIAHGSLTYTNEAGLDGMAHCFTFRENQQDNSKGRVWRAYLKDGSIVYKNGPHLPPAEDDEL